MKLVQFQFINEKKEELKYVNQKFQFFYHFWEFTMSKYNRILLANYTFESHRTLLEKTLNFLNGDYRNSKKKYEKYFKNHIYFEPNNIILKDITNIKLIEETKKLVYKTSKTEIIESINKINNHLTKRINYSAKVTKKLTKILCSNKPYSSNVEEDIKFLIHCLIIEL